MESTFQTSLLVHLGIIASLNRFQDRWDGRQWDVYSRYE